jgi:hypothetical protein
VLPVDEQVKLVGIGGTAGKVVQVTVELNPLFPPGPMAMIRYLYVVEAPKPVLLQLVPAWLWTTLVGVQPVPAQRSTL